jgi:hypothetical protein
MKPIAIRMGDVPEPVRLPEKNHAYVMTVDVSRGVDLDYSTFTVIDISVHPYVIAAVYRNNMPSRRWCTPR